VGIKLSKKLRELLVGESLIPSQLCELPTHVYQPCENQKLEFKGKYEYGFEARSAEVYFIFMKTRKDVV
jgi:hypothetical protein